MQYCTNSEASEFLELLLKLITGAEWNIPAAEWNIPAAEQTSQHKFTDWRSTVVFWGVVGLILD
jgi:hypothetical protein